MVNKPFKLMITGHRPQKLGGFEPNPTKDWVCTKLTETLKEAKEKHPDLEVITGMALGVDQWWAEEAFSLQIPFHAYVPFQGQESKWTASSQSHWRELISHAKTVTTVCDGGYAPWKMQKRNEAMVNDADACVAVWNEIAGGGTYNCIRYIVESGKPLYLINPIKKTRNWRESL